MSRPKTLEGQMQKSHVYRQNSLLVVKYQKEPIAIIGMLLSR